MPCSKGPLRLIARARSCSTISPAQSRHAIRDGYIKRCDFRKDGGARRDRTDDLLLAKQALSQLSYGPINSVARQDDLIRSNGGAETGACYLRMAAGGQPLFSGHLPLRLGAVNDGRRDSTPAAPPRYLRIGLRQRCPAWHREPHHRSPRHHGHSARWQGVDHGQAPPPHVWQAPEHAAMSHCSAPPTR